MSQANRPDRFLVRQVVDEEAKVAGLPFDQILNSNQPTAVASRRRAFRRIKALTGCSTFGLAAVFGCDHGAVLDALREPERRQLLKAPAGFKHSDVPPHELGAALTCFAAIDDYTSRRGA